MKALTQDERNSEEKWNKLHFTLEEYEKLSENPSAFEEFFMNVLVFICGKTLIKKWPTETVVRMLTVDTVAFGLLLVWNEEEKLKKHFAHYAGEDDEKETSFGDSTFAKIQENKKITDHVVKKEKGSMGKPGWDEDSLNKLEYYWNVVQKHFEEHQDNWSSCVGTCHEKLVTLGSTATTTYSGKKRSYAHINWSPL